MHVSNSQKSLAVISVVCAALLSSGFANSSAALYTEVPTASSAATSAQINSELRTASKILKSGSRGREVHAMQRRICYVLQMQVGTDGIWGPRTSTFHRYWVRSTGKKYYGSHMHVPGYYWDLLKKQAQEAKNKLSREDLKRLERIC